MACNLCAVACPVGCISLEKSEREDGRWYPEVSLGSTSPAASSAACAKACPPQLSS
ncbi:4Fe-4S dicluster domain-containing protein [Escherichia coli]